jgi:hypothetical protein
MKDVYQLSMKDAMQVLDKHGDKVRAMTPDQVIAYLATGPEEELLLVLAAVKTLSLLLPTLAGALLSTLNARGISPSMRVLGIS